MKQNNSIVIYLISFLIFSLSSHLFAEIYQWEDEDGKTHYGDKEPETYNKSTLSIDLPETSTFEGSKLKLAPPAPAVAEEKSSRARPAPTQKVDPPEKKENSCDAESAEYEASLLCFSKCRTVYGTINEAKCPECVSVAMPACYPDKKDKIVDPLLTPNNIW